MCAREFSIDYLFIYFFIAATTTDCGICEYVRTGCETESSEKRTKTHIKKHFIDEPETHSAAAMTITINNHNNRCDATENCIKYISGEWVGGRAGRKHNLLWFRHCFVGTYAPLCCSCRCSHPETSNYKSTEFHLNRLQLVPSRVWLWTTTLSSCDSLQPHAFNWFGSRVKTISICLSPNTTSVQKPFVSLNRMYAFAIRGFSTLNPQTTCLAGTGRNREKKNTITHHIVFLGIRDRWPHINHIHE